MFGEYCSVVSGAYGCIPPDRPAAGFIATEYPAVNRGYPYQGGPGRPAVTVQDPVYTLYPLGGKGGGSYPGSHDDRPRGSVDDPLPGEADPEVRASEAEAEIEAAVGVGG